MEPLGFVCLHRMGLALHQSGHGHSHGHSHDNSSQQQNPSVRAAFIHVIGDLLQSVGVLVAAYIIYFKVRTGHRERDGRLPGALLSAQGFFNVELPAVWDERVEKGEE